MRTGDVVGRGACEEASRLRHRDRVTSDGRRLSQGAIGEVGQDRHPVVFRSQLGWPRIAPARQFRRIRARRLQAEMAGGPWHRTLDTFLHRLWTSTAAAV